MLLIKQKEISECIGLYIGDGLRSMKGSSKYRISFTNNDLTLIKKMMKFFEWLGIPISKIYSQIDIPYGKNINKIKLEILNEIKIDFKNTLIRTEKRKKPAVQIRAFNKKIREKLNKIIEDEISSISIKNATNILRGLFAAEGRVKLQNKSLNAICIATSETKNYMLLNKILRILDFKFYYSVAEFYIHSFYQFKKFKKMKLHVLHSEKRKKFEKAYGVLEKTFTWRKSHKS